MLEYVAVYALLEMFSILVLPLFLGWSVKLILVGLTALAWWYGFYSPVHVFLAVWAASYVVVLIAFGPACRYVGDKLAAAEATLKDHSYRDTLKERRADNRELGLERRQTFKRFWVNLYNSDLRALVRYIFLGR